MKLFISDKYLKIPLLPLTGHFGLWAEMSWDTSAPGLKCLGAEVSGYLTATAITGNRTWTLMRSGILVGNANHLTHSCLASHYMGHLI